MLIAAVTAPGAGTIAAPIPPDDPYIPAATPSIQPNIISYWGMNVYDYAQFAGWMAERYDGDGIDDAPGSPRIAAWEIWNEPNDTQLWPNIGGGADARKRRYGDLLVAAYQAIKAADPTATVLTGG